MPSRSRLPRPLDGVPVPAESPPRALRRDGRGAIKLANPRTLMLRWRLREVDRALREARRVLEALAYTPGVERTVAYARVDRLRREQERLRCQVAGGAR